MVQWRFDANNYDPNRSFELVPAGEHKVRIEEAAEAVSRSGYPMIKLTLAVSGHSAKLWHYVTFMEDKREVTDQSLGALFDCFAIPPGDLNYPGWVGRVGSVRVKHELYQDRQVARIAWLIPRGKQDSSTPWTEPGGKKNGGVGGEDFSSVRGYFPEPVSEDEVDDLPF